MTSPYTEKLKELRSSYVYRILPNGKILIIYNRFISLSPRYQGFEIDDLNSTLKQIGSGPDPNIIGGFISESNSNELLYYFEDKFTAVLINPNPDVFVITGTFVQNLFNIPDKCKNAAYYIRVQLSSDQHTKTVDPYIAETKNGTYEIKTTKTYIDHYSEFGWVEHPKVCLKIALIGNWKFPQDASIAYFSSGSPDTDLFSETVFPYFHLKNVDIDYMDSLLASYQDIKQEYIDGKQKRNQDDSDGCCSLY